MSKQYSDKEKIAYYKKKALVSANPRKQYRKKNNYRKNNNYKKNKYMFPGLGKSIGSNLGKYTGNYLFPGFGDYVGGPIGGVIGDQAHSLIKRVTGFGDYHISKNSLIYNIDAIPEFSYNNERCTVVCHREFIDDIKSSITFNANHYRINPSITNTFPWLSSIAENFEQYVVQGMIFEFKTTSATAIGSTNTTLGTVILATQYNSLAPEFTSKQQMENYEFCQSSVPSQSIIHAIECDPLQTQCGGIFNMYNPNDTSGDTRLYDIGRFTIATVGMQAADAIIGELWVSYKICLLKPRLTGMQNVMDGYTIEASSCDVSAPLGALGTLTEFPENSGFTSPNESTANRIDIDPGFIGLIQVTVYYNFSTAASTTWTLPYINITGNGSNLNLDYLGYDTTNLQTGVLMSGAAAQKSCAITGFFKVDGGYIPSSGAKTYISVSNMTITGGVAPYFDAGVIFINSIPSTFDLS